jgi:TolB-like protein
LPNLKVMSRNSVFRYKGQEVAVSTVANTLRVRRADGADRAAR